MQAGIQAVGDTYTRKALISPTREAVGKDGKRHRYPSRARQSKLLGIARSTSYYKRKEGHPDGAGEADMDGLRIVGVSRI